MHTGRYQLTCAQSGEEDVRECIGGGVTGRYVCGFIRIVAWKTTSVCVFSKDTESSVNPFSNGVEVTPRNPPLKTMFYKALCS